MIKQRIRLAALLFALVLALSGCAAASPAAEPTATPWPANAEGRPYALIDFEGSPMTFSDLKGKVVYLNFFTTWCYFCKLEMPDLLKLQKNHSEGLAVVLIHVPYEDTEEAAVSYLKDNGLEALRMVEDTDLFLSSVYSVEAFPFSVIIDREGYLMFKQAGALTYEQMEWAVKTASLETAVK